MPLDKQVVGIDFKGGIETQEDARLVPAGKMLGLENYSLAESNALTRRDGHETLVSVSATGLATFNKELLTTSSAGALSTFSDVNNTLYSRGVISPITIKKQGIRRMIGYQCQADCATGSNYTAYVWREFAADQTTALGIYCTVIDEQTGAAVVANTALTASTTAEVPRVVYVTTTTGSSDRPAFIFGWADGVNLAIGAIDISNSFNIVAAANKVTTLYSGRTIDAIESSGNALFVYTTTTGTDNIRAEHFKFASGAVTSNVTAIGIGVAVFTNYIYTMALTLGKFSTAGKIAWGMILNDGAGTAYAAASVLTATATTLTGPNAPTSRDTNVSAFGPSHMTCTATGSDVVFYVDQAASWQGGTVAPIRTFTISTANALVSAAATFVNSNIGAAPTPQGPFIAGKAFTRANKPYLPVYTGGVSAATATYPVVNFQDTWFLYDSAANIVGKALYGGFGLWAIGTAAPDSKSIPSTPAYTDGAYVIVPVGEKGELSFSGTQQITPVGLSRLVVKFDFESLPPMSVQLGQNTFHAGGVLTAYDGRVVTEAGFHMFPEALTVVDGAAGSVDIGFHSYVACYEWTDNAGQRHQSAPTPVANYYSAPGAKKATVTIPTLRMTGKTGVNIAVFRTVAGGTTFYRLNAQNAPIANSSSASTVTYTDNTTDANLVSGELLYTTGGTLPNNGPPACAALCIHQNRLVLGGLEDSSAFQYSQPQVNGFGLQWNETLSGRIAGSGGALCAVESLDEKLILFGERKPFVVGGQGPNATGSQNGYSQPDEILSDVGCSDPRSVLRMPNGIMFRATPTVATNESKGYHLLSRGLQVQFIGSAVQSFAYRNVTSSVLLEDRREARFYLYSTGGLTSVLAYSYLTDQWSTFTNASDNITASDALWWPAVGKVVVMNINAILCQDTPGFFLDGADPIVGTIDTGWLKPGQTLHGFQRVYKLLLEGAYNGKSSLAISVYYDFSTTAAYTTTVADTSVLNTGGSWALEWQLPVQKCAAIRFRIVDTPTTAAYAGLDFSSMSLEVGLKRGPVKLPTAKRV